MENIQTKTVMRDEVGQRLAQCVDCWHRWQLAWYSPIDPCPECGSLRQVYVSAITACLTEEIDYDDAWNRIAKENAVHAGDEV